jgi:hypothetical protein
MMARAPRYAVFAHDPEGDMTEGVVLGAFRSVPAAERAARRVSSVEPYVEAYVVDMLPGNTPRGEVARRVWHGR